LVKLVMLMMIVNSLSDVDRFLNVVSWFLIMWSPWLMLSFLIRNNYNITIGLCNFTIVYTNFIDCN
jgi:hypothetical protein